MTRPFHPDDLHRIRQVTDVRWHPDGDRVAYVVGWADRETDANRSELRLASVSTGEDRPLSRGHLAAQPIWSPDGRRLAYSSTAEPKTPPQLHVLDVGGGEPAVLTDRPDGVRDVVWLGDDELLVIAPVRPEHQDGADDEELGRRIRVITELDYRLDGAGFTHDRRAQLHRVGLDGEVTPLTDHPKGVGQPVVSADGSRVALAIGDHDRLLAGRVAVLDLTSGDLEVVEDDPGDWIPFVWHGDALVVIGVIDNGQVGLAHLGVLDAGARTVRRVDADDVSRAAIGGPRRAILHDDAVYVPASRRARVHVDRVDLATGDGETIVGGTRCADAFDVRSDGAVIAAVATPTRPAELVLVTADGERTLTDLNPWLDEIELGAVEEVLVPSTDDVEVQAWVVRPPASAPDVGAPGPGLIYVHGGPLATYGARFFDEFQVAAACGYTVIGGNPRGADGFGTEWARAIVDGRMGQPDWDDVQALADHLTGLPEVDDGRVGIGGGSYGGWMTGWAIGHTDRFGAALIERAVTNWETMCSTADFTYLFAPLYLGVHDVGDVEELRRQSPVHHLDGATTPTLVLHSESDLRCPIEQGEQMFVGLKRRGVDVTFARVPGEGHELTRSGKPSRRIDRFELVHGFYADHLGGGRVGDPPAGG
ncbi:MAG: S9 family peptidase [Actinomycetota bacterium]